MIDFNRYDLIIFDCDGTLVDTEWLSNSIISKILGEIGISYSVKECLHEFKGKRFSAITDFIEKRIDAPLNFNVEKEFRRRCKIAFENELKAIPFAIDFIKTLKTQFCIASNGPKEKMKVSLGATGFFEFISEDKIYSAYDIDSFKPDPGLFLHVAQSQNVNPERCLVFEDTQSGIDAAIAADMDIIALLHPGINNDILQYDIPFIRTYKSLIH